MRWLVIVNPNAGHARRSLRDLPATLSQGGLTDVEIQTSSQPGDATILAREGVRNGVDRVLVVGGDGTIHEVIQALAGSSTPLGLLPCGTANLLAKELGYPSVPFAELIHLLKTAEVRRMDLGRLNDRYFALMTGIGFDAWVVAAVPPRLKRLAGRGASVLAAIRHLINTYSVTLEIDNDGITRKMRTPQVIVANSNHYAANRTLHPDISIWDGELNLLVTHSGKWGGFTLLQQGIALMLNRLYKRRNLQCEKARRISIAGDRPQPVQMDGEAVSTWPLEFSIEPAALPVLILSSD